MLKKSASGPADGSPADGNTLRAPAMSVEVHLVSSLAAAFAFQPF
jgi:hypothetical protein